MERYRWSILIRLDVGRPDHLGPLLGIVGDESTKVGRGTHKRYAPKSASQAFNVGLASPALISLLSFYLDGRVLGNDKAKKLARLITRHKFGYGRDVRQDHRARRRGHRQGTQLAVYKLDSEPLAQFIRRKGGINACAARSSRSLGRD
jgi:hypothetical protein